MIRITIDIDPFDGTGDECPIEAALRKHDWIADAMVGGITIDVLSTTGKVARFPLSGKVWAQACKFADNRPGGGVAIELEAGQIIGKVVKIEHHGRIHQIIQRTS